MSRPALVALGGALAVVTVLAMLVALGARVSRPAPPSLPCAATDTCARPPHASPSNAAPTPPPLAPPERWDTRNGD